MTRAGGYSMLQALPDASSVLTVLSVGRLLNKANLHLFIICVICYRADITKPRVTSKLLHKDPLM